MGEIKKYILEKIISKCSDIYNKLQTNEELKLPYNTLTPTNNAYNVDEYLNSINWALNKKNVIKNIAIAGPYGSGKSSVIKTFLKKYNNANEHRFLNISLATFKDNNAEIENKDNDILRLIELSLLQQLFYHEKDSDIPDSRFKKIKKYTKIKLLAISISISVFIISFLFLVFPDFLSNFALIMLNEKSEEIFQYISSVIMFLGLVIIIYKSIRILNNFTIKTFSINEMSIEIDNSISKSILNNHIDEIIYFFEVTNYNVILFEDLDRFEQTEIFTKLREINLIINNSRKIDRDIVFVYAIKDDMFEDKNRTKFFDFIIPIIPVINSSNSKDKFVNIIKENNYKISTDIIEDISIFIDDMRLLYNIMNEYHHYFLKMNNNLDQNKLLSMIIYKNLFPNDFAKLSLNEGVLYSIINKKHEYIDEIIDKIDSEIENKKNIINLIENEKLKSLKELRLLYLFKIYEISNNQGIPLRGFIINEKVLNIDQMIEDEYYYYLAKRSEIHITQNGNLNSRNVIRYNMQNIEKQIDSEYSYEQREKIITSKKDIDILKNEIDSLEIKKDFTRKSSLKDLLFEKNVSIASGNINQKQLINIILKNGYIDENYFDYISIFHEGTLSKNDYQFLINIKTQVDTNFDFALNNFDNLIKRINIIAFDREYILNYSLFNYVLGNEKYKKMEKQIFILLSSESERCIRFIDGFSSFTSKPELFFKLLCKYWTNIWNYIYSKSGYPSNKIENYLKSIIENIDRNEINLIFKEQKDSLINNTNFLKLTKNYKQLKMVISVLELRFTKLLENTPEQIIEKLYDGDYYELNVHNIIYFFNHYGIELDDNFYNQNYTKILESDLGNMINYISNNIGEYIENVYLSFEEKNYEPEDSVLQLLNNNDIEIKSRIAIVKKINNKIDNIEEIVELEILKCLFLNHKIDVNWKNILTFYEKIDYSLDSILINYLNDKKIVDKLANTRISYNDNIELTKKFCVELILKENISEENYLKYLKSIPYIYKSLDFSNLSYSKVRILISNKKLSVSKENFSLLKDNFYELRINLLEQDDKIIISDFNDLELDDEDVVEILRSMEISILIKEEIIRLQEVNALVLKQKILTQIGNLLLKTNNLEVDNKIIKASIKDSLLETEYKIKLFNKYSNIFENEEIRIFISSLDEPYSIILQNGKRPLLESNEYNLELVKILKYNTIISKFKNEEKGIRISTFRN